jgi:ArsR family transcriptional regulator
MATNGECCDGGAAAPRAAPRPARLAESRRFAQRFYALGDEIRLEVLGLLRGGERCVCELTAPLELAQSRLSFHLKVLKDAGLVSHRREGRWSYYALDAEALRELEAFLGRVPPVAGPCCQALEPAAAAVSRRRKEQR